MKIFLPLLVGLMAIVPDAAAAGRPPPNIVLLYADDMGYGDLAIQNPQSKIPTPNLDRLAREGMRFTDAHSSSGVCTPSRYALLTGRFHWRKFHGIVNSFGPPVLDPAEVTLPEVLKTRGYRTACFGKWHLGWNWSDILRPGVTPQMDAKARNKIYAPGDFDWSRPISGGPLAHGFDHYFGDDVPNFPPYAWFENDRVITTPSVPLDITAETREGSWESRPGPMTPGWDFYAVLPHITGKAVEWIGRQRGRREPFFLYAPFNSPHAPIVPAEEYRGKSQAGGYGDFMVQTDAEVGRILRAVEENGFAANTIVIFTADNGAERYAYERVRRFQHRSSGPLRGLKRDLYEGGHRVPFLAKWPGVIAPGSVSDALVSQIDLMATLAAAAGAELPANSAHDSHNLLPVWKGGGGPGPRRTLVHNTVADTYAIRHENWVLIAHRTGAHTPVPEWFNQENGYKRNDQPGELYDLAADLAQKHNLYSSRPDKVAELTKRLAEVRAQGQVR